VQQRREQRRGTTARAAVAVAVAQLWGHGGSATTGGAVDQTAWEDNGMAAAREDNGSAVEDE
jgi:hypothetical protein